MRSTSLGSRRPLVRRTVSSLVGFRQGLCVFQRPAVAEVDRDADNSAMEKWCNIMKDVMLPPNLNDQTSRHSLANG
jgi:hypothetical protein